MKSREIGENGGFWSGIGFVIIFASRHRKFEENGIFLRYREESKAFRVFGLFVLCHINYHILPTLPLSLSPHLFPSKGGARGPGGPGSLAFSLIYYISEKGGRLGYDNLYPIYLVIGDSRICAGRE